MVIGRGEDWGTSGVPDTGTPKAESDHEASLLLGAGCREFVVSHGDMARTIGAVVPTDSTAFRRLPVDLTIVEFVPRCSQSNGSAIVPIPMLSHCLVRLPWWRGGLLRGPVTVVCNAQFVKGRDVAPRGHPNDGAVDIIEFSAALSARERLRVLRRLRTGDHLPHPSIRTRRVTSSRDVDVTGCVVVDGIRRGRGTIRSLRIEADAVIVWAALPTPPDEPSAEE